MEAELVLLIALCAMLVGLVSSLVFTERGRTKKFSWCSSWSLLLIFAEAGVWLSLLSSATSADFCLLSWTTEVLASGWSYHC